MSGNLTLVLAGDLFNAFDDLRQADGVPGLSNLPGPWVRQIDGNWTLVINGHREPREALVPAGTGTPITVKPFHAALFWRGWPAGVLTPMGGVMAGHPDHDGANAAHLLRAIRAAIAEGRRP